jgi:hypothetical protein
MKRRESLPIKRNTKLIPIIAIDDVTGIFTDTGSNNKNENSHQLAIKLKDLAKVYNMIIVLAVPSSNTYIKATGHMSSLEEVALTIYMPTG